MLTDTKVAELIFDGASLTLFESTLEWDLGGKNEVVEDDFGSPTPKKPSLLETASPTKCAGQESPRPPPLSEPGRGRFWREGRESSSLADGRRSEETTEGLIGRTSWDLRPGIIFGVLFRADLWTQCQSSGRQLTVWISVPGQWHGGIASALSLSGSDPTQTAKRVFRC